MATTGKHQTPSGPTTLNERNDEASSSAASRPYTPGGKVDLINFKEALELSRGHGKRHLMLGNGFSIAVRPKIFSYNTLLERAKGSGRLTEELSGVFAVLGTTDFENVMEALEKAAILVSIFESTNPALAARLKSAAAQLRDVLAETIAEHHPSRPNEITLAQYASCRRFLSCFNGNIYTLNYDLLLYWTLMQAEIPPQLTSDDGFRNSEDESLDFVVWDVQNTNRQRIYYLHGALHIYDAGAELLKYTWSKTNIALVDQIRQSLEMRRYPLIVTEGSSSQKKERIQHSGYLNRGYRSFSEIGGNLFVYGHSFAENDEHLLKLIDGGNIRQLFVGIYDDPELPRNKSIIQRAQLMETRRVESGDRLSIHFFDAQSAHVWDGQDFGLPEDGTEGS